MHLVINTCIEIKDSRTDEDNIMNRTRHKYSLMSLYFDISIPLICTMIFDITLKFIYQNIIRNAVAVLDTTL